MASADAFFLENSAAGRTPVPDHAHWLSASVEEAIAIQERDQDADAAGWKICLPLCPTAGHSMARLETAKVIWRSGKIRTHQRQQLGAEFRPAGHEFRRLLPVPLYNRRPDTAEVNN